MNWINWVLIPLAVLLAASIFWPEVQRLIGKAKSGQPIVAMKPSRQPDVGSERANAWAATETLVNYFTSVGDDEGLRKAVEVGRALYPDPKSIDTAASRTKAKG